jgi:hypothetical protein
MRWPGRPDKSGSQKSRRFAIKVWEKDEPMTEWEAGTGSEIAAHAGCGRLARSRASLAAWALAALLIIGPVASGVCSAATDAPSEPARSVALLNVQFLNDHEDLEPTTATERARIGLIASVFKTKLEASGRYAFVSIPAEAAAKIAAGPEVGACGGCELKYGKQLGADTVAWIVIQKVSDLILNINVYMADVGTGKLAFVHSVDIRGDTDESWTRGVTYLVKNYLLPAP